MTDNVTVTVLWLKRPKLNLEREENEQEEEKPELYVVKDFADRVLEKRV